LIVASSIDAASTTVLSGLVHCRESKLTSVVDAGVNLMISTLDILKAKILIVDDALANVRLLDLMLKDAGYSSVTSTGDPRAVYELHRVNDFDLIVLDLLMPGMDGFQVMEGLKEFERDGYLPVLVTSALIDHKVRALKLGAKDFISKPIDRAELLIRVHNMLEVRLLYKDVCQINDNTAINLLATVPSVA
jgi:CheY-like chemotaxis protein